MNKINFSFRPLEHQKSSITKMKNIENNMISFSDIKVRSKIGILTDPKNSGKKTTMSYFLKRTLKQLAKECFTLLSFDFYQ